MGVMGGVRRRCDTVTAFMFLPKHPHPRGGNSDPFSCWHYVRLDEILLMLPTIGFERSVIYLYSSISCQHHILLASVRDMIKKNYAFFE